MTSYREQVADVLAAVAIRDGERYTWLGRHSRAPEASLDAPGRRAHLLHTLGEELYWSFYCRGGVVPARWGEPEPVGTDARLHRAIGAANTGGEGWETGWVVDRVRDDEVVLSSSRARVRARTALSACRAGRGDPVAGAEVSIATSQVPSALSPGFLTLAGDAGDEGSAGVVRVYWHVVEAGAPALVHALTALLNRDAAPFRLKVADHPMRYDRCDAGVLYLPAARFAALRARLRAFASQLARWLRPELPAFTLPLAPGVGLAESGSAGESFGERRCALVAEGILEAHDQGAGDDGARLAAVEARFARAGVDVDAPYLDPALDGGHVL